MDDELLTAPDPTALGCAGTELDLLWNLADDLDFVELNEDAARRGTGIEKWRDGTDEPRQPATRPSGCSRSS